ncbi:MAG: VWA domain-containing protein [Clostridia bacterium]
MLVNVSFASYSTVTMSVVEEPICTIQLSDNSKFEKKLISKDLQNKEVTLQLQVTNEEKSNKPTGEIMLVLDNSDSMKLETSTETVRKDLVFESAKTLVSNLLKDNENLKIGVVSFSTNTDVSKEGTTEDAEVVSKLSNDSNALLNSISSIEATGPRTDLEAGLEIASGEFTKTDNNKYMIVLTDGVPNVALNYNKVYYSDDVITKTKTKLEALKTANVDVITMLTGIDNPEQVPAGVTKSYNQIITEIFGTQENPTVGTFYYVTDDKVESTIKNDIYNSLVPEEKTLKDIKVVDYFPKEIIDNFDFSYVSNANIGEISTTVDKANNSITWNIPSLASGQTATVQYKLKLKENFDSNIVNKILNTNEKVDVTYTDLDNKSQAKTSDVSPKLKLTEPPARLPKAGTTTFVAIAILATGLLVFSITKLTILNNKMK